MTFIEMNLDQLKCIMGFQCGGACKPTFSIKAVRGSMANFIVVQCLVWSVLTIGYNTLTKTHYCLFVLFHCSTDWSIRKELFHCVLGRGSQNISLPNEYVLYLRKSYHQAGPRVFILFYPIPFPAYNAMLRIWMPG